MGHNIKACYEAECSISTHDINLFEETSTLQPAMNTQTGFLKKKYAFRVIY